MRPPDPGVYCYSRLRQEDKLDRREAVLAILALGAMPLAAKAQQYPSKPLRIIVPVGPGSGLDARSREIAARLSEYLKQQVIVENRPGAGGIIAMGIVGKSPPDGYTLVISPIATVAYFPTLYRKLSYSPSDFAPVSLLATGPSAVYASPSLPASSVKELLSLARAKPGELTFASQGKGTFQHLAGELFKQIGNVDLLHVPYKEYGQILTDVESGRVSLLFDSTGAVLAHVQAGKLKALGVTGMQRLKSLPDVPTFSEAGMPAYGAEINYGIFAPAGTPQTIIDALSLACAKAQASKEIQEILGRFGFTSRGTTPAEFTSYIVKERDRWTGVVKATGLQLDY
jgi:tripartite-type tricarboxylate transporter receptor subunit TctC